MAKAVSLQELANAETQLRNSQAPKATKGPKIPKGPKQEATVDTFLMVLTSQLVQYDTREMNREMKHGRGNVYRLGLLFEAQNKVTADCADVLNRSDAAAMNVLKQSLARQFTRDFSPVTNVVRQIDSWVKDGRFPSIIRK